MRQLLACCGLAALLCLEFGCGSDAPTPEKSELSSAPEPTATTDGPVFVDVTADSGVDATYRNGEESGHASILESLGGGIAIFDYDGDELLDLFFPGGGYFRETNIHGLPPKLYHNLGDFRFEDVTERAGLGESGFYSHGCAAADFDNDGRTDLLVTGYGGLQLWRNQGNGTFRDVAQTAGLIDPVWSSSAAWGDFNQDGHLDLYVAHYVDWSFDNHPFCPGPQPDTRDICSPREFEGVTDRLFYSRGDGTFRDATAKEGLKPQGKGLGVVAADVDVDGDLDIYVANDTVDNFLYLNQGDGRFEEVGLIAGVARDDQGVPNGSMGVDVCDYNLDGLPDLWCANYERESMALYRNEGAAQFLHVSKSTGITSIGGLYVGFGTAFFDIDRDGAEDVVVANGHVVNYPRGSPKAQVPLLLFNEGGRFRRATFPADDYFSQPRFGRGLAVGDLNNDGRLDLVITHVNAPAVILANSRTTGEWLQVQLTGTRSNRSGIGARLVLETPAGQYHRQVKGGGSYLSQSALRVHWGLPAGETPTSLTVHWPSGKIQKITQIQMNSTIQVREP